MKGNAVKDHSIRFCSMVAMLIVFSQSAISSGQEASPKKRPPLRLTLEVMSAAMRSSAPVPLIATFESSEKGIIEGHLNLVLKEDGTAIGRVRIDDLALVQGQYVIRIMLPPIDPPFERQLEVTAWLDSSKKTYELGEHPLLFPDEMQRATVICTCSRSVGLPSAVQRRLIDSLYLNNFNPERGQAETLENANRRIVTYPAIVRPDDFPADPLTCCAWDVVVLSDGGLSQLRDKPLEALLQWVDAGGSVCIVPDDTLETRHVTFLNQLIAQRTGESPFVTDGNGRISSTPESIDTDGILLTRRGLGRAAILMPGGAWIGKVTTQGVPQVAAHLWRFRHDQPVAAGKSWVIHLPDHLSPERLKKIQQESRQYGYDYRDSEYILTDFMKLNLQRTPAMNGLLTRLMPPNVRMVPLGMIGAILVLYVLAIGPGDYMLLGLLRLRKFTWFLFPVVTIAFTAFTVWLSHHYMASSESGAALSVIDLGENNRVVRTNRFQLRFTGTRREETTDVQMGMFAAFNHRKFNAGAASFGPPMPSNDLTSLVETADYSGRMPYRYSVHQSIPQWTPQLNRLFTIAPKDVSMDNFDWDDPGDLSTVTGRDTLGLQIREAFGESAGAWLMNANQFHMIVRGEIRMFNSQNANEFGYGAARFGYTHTRSVDFLNDICKRESRGLFSFISSIAPTGGTNFEDLTLLDTTNPDEWLLVVATQAGEDLTLYRRLYDFTGRSEPASPETSESAASAPPTETPPTETFAEPETDQP